MRQLLPPRYLTGENGKCAMTHKLTSNEGVVESQRLLKLQSGKITKIQPRFVTAKCPRV